MFESGPTYDTHASDPERRRFLASLERALELRELLDVSWEYRRVELHPEPWKFECLGLVITVAGLEGEARVVPISVVQRSVSTRPGGEGLDPPELSGMLDAMRASLRHFGISGVSAPEARYEPFPGEGESSFELTIWEPGHTEVSQRGMTMIEHRDTTDPTRIVDQVVAWRDASRSQHPPTPRGAKSLSKLRALVQARRELTATLDPDRIAELRRVDRVRESWRLAGLQAMLDPQRPKGKDLRLSAAADAQLRADLAHLDPVALLHNFPRDDRGKLALGETVLLETYENEPPLGPNKRPWLVARGPVRRRDLQCLTLELVPLVGEYYSHRWERARWLWDERAQDTPLEMRWGLADLPLAHLGFDAWRKRAEVQSDDAELSGTAPGERAGLSVLRQDAGRLAEALALYGVEIDPEVGRLLDGAPLGYNWRREAEPWARAVQEGLRASAPWRFEPLLRAAAADLASRRSGKPARRLKPPRLRLFWLPHQTTVSKGAVILTSRDVDGGGPKLELEWSASLNRLPLPSWQRAVEIDLLRFGLSE